jgi:leucyl aminopeptidase
MRYMSKHAPASPAESATPELVQPDRGQAAITIHLIDKAGFDGWQKSLTAAQRASLIGAKFKGEAGAQAIVPDGDGWAVAAGVADLKLLKSWCLAKLAETLPAGAYRLALPKGAETRAAPAFIGWALGQYRFERYRAEAKAEGPRILLTAEVKPLAAALAQADAVSLVRDLVNTGPEHMGPAELEHQVEHLAHQFRAQVRVTRGEVLEHEYPCVHMVGRAAARSHAPRLIELEWGDEKAPRLAIVGKGVCFDSGGLDIKPASGMLLMKKDMGGAAHAIALARW